MITYLSTSRQIKSSKNDIIFLYLTEYFLNRISNALIKRTHRLSIFSNTLSRVPTFPLWLEPFPFARRPGEGGDWLVVNSLDTREGWLRSEKARKGRGKKN